MHGKRLLEFQQEKMKIKRENKSFSSQLLLELFKKVFKHNLAKTQNLCEFTKKLS